MPISVISLESLSTRLTGRVVSAKWFLPLAGDIVALTEGTGTMSGNILVQNPRVPRMTVTRKHSQHFFMLPQYGEKC